MTTCVCMCLFVSHVCSVLMCPVYMYVDVWLDWPEVTQLVCEFGPSPAQPSLPCILRSTTLLIAHTAHTVHTAHTAHWLIFLIRQAGARTEEGSSKASQGLQRWSQGYPRGDPQRATSPQTCPQQGKQSRVKGLEMEGGGGACRGSPASHRTFFPRPQEAGTSHSPPQPSPFITALHHHLAEVETSPRAPAPLGWLHFGHQKYSN